MTAIVVTFAGVILLTVAGFLIHPAAGLGVVGAVLLAVGLLADFGDET